MPESQPVPAIKHGEDDKDDRDGESSGDDNNRAHIKVEPQDGSEGSDNDAVANNMDPNTQHVGVGHQAQGGIAPMGLGVVVDPVRAAVRGVLNGQFEALGGVNSCGGSPFDQGSDTARTVQEAARRTHTYLCEVLQREMRDLETQVATMGLQGHIHQAGGAFVPGGLPALPLGPNPDPLALLGAPPPPPPPPQPAGPTPLPALVPIVQGAVQAQPIAQGIIGKPGPITYRATQRKSPY